MSQTPVIHDDNRQPDVQTAPQVMRVSADDKLRATNDPSIASIDQRPSGTRYLLLIWMCAAAAIVYIQRSAMGVVATNVQSDLALSEVEMGWVMAAFFWSYGLSQIPMGYLGQRWGSRLGLLVAMLATSLMCILVGASWNLTSILIFWMAAGITTAGVFPCCVQSLSAWFPAKQMALPSGLLGSAMSVGAAISTALTGMLLTASESLRTSLPDSPLTAWLSWRGVFVLYALPGVLWGVWFYCWFRNRPEDHPRVNAAELAQINEDRPVVREETGARVSVPWKQLLLGRQMLLISGQQMFRSAGYAFFGTWFPTYLQRVHDVSVGWSGLLTSIPLIGVIIGGAAAGVISDWILQRTGSRRLSRQYLGGGGQLLCSITVLLAWCTSDIRLAVLLIALGSIAMAFGGCCAYSLIMENTRPHVAPAYGTMNTAGNIGATLSPLAASWIAVQFGWDQVLLLYAGFFLLSFSCWMGIRPEKHLFEKPDTDVPPACDAGGT